MINAVVRVLLDWLQMAAPSTLEYAHACRRPAEQLRSVHYQGEPLQQQIGPTQPWGRRDSEPAPRAQAVHGQYVSDSTGAGKTWLACALAQYACRRGKSALYQRVPRLGEELRIRHGNGTFGKWLIALAKTDVLLLDDWGMAGIDSQTRADLLEIIDDRAGNKATIITSQLPIEHWHAWIGDATIADAILDRVMQKNHRFNLMGESLRGNAKSATPGL